MDKEKVRKIGTEAARIYFDYNCTPEQAIETARRLYESGKKEENEMRRCFDMLHEAIKGGE